MLTLIVYTDGALHRAAKRSLQQNPFDAEAQTKIEEIIR